MKLEGILSMQWLVDIDAIGPEAKAAVVDVIGRYGGWAADSVGWELREVARNTKDKETVIKVAKIMSLDEVVRTVRRYEGWAAGSVAEWLAWVARGTKDKETVVESARVIGRYEGETAHKVAWVLGEIAMGTKDKDAVIESARIIGRYEGWASYGIAWGVGEIARNTKDKETVMTACRLVNTAGSGVFDLLDAKDVVSIRESGLDKLIDGKSSFDAVVAYVKSGKELPLPTSENIADYGKLVKDHLASAYGMDKELDNDRLLMLFSVDRSERKALAELVNRSSERDRRAYSIMVNEGSEHSLDIDRSRLPYLSVVAIVGSKEPARYREAFDVVSRIVGKKAVRFARDSFNSSYKPKLEEIVGLVGKGKVEDAVKVLRETKNESINDVLSVSDYKRDPTIVSGRNVLWAVESNDPLDYDSRVQMACVYLPRYFHEGIYDYCRDKRFTLVRYDINGKTVGSAICYAEGDRFLVDSIEGHRTFRKPQIFDAVYKDLMDRARSKGYKEIIFSNGGTNETPKRFIEYLGSVGLKNGKVKMDLDTKGYLEADEDGVDGYVVSLERHRIIF